MVEDSSGIYHSETVTDHCSGSVSGEKCSVDG